LSSSLKRSFPYFGDACGEGEGEKLTDLIIAKLDNARRLLSEAKTLQETKNIVDIAAAAEVYARRQQLGEEAIGHTLEIKIYALRKLREILEH